MVGVKMEGADVLQKLADAVDKIDWRDIGIMAEVGIHRNFDEGGRYTTPGSPIGGTNKWRKRKKGKPYPILQDTLALENSVYSEPDDKGVTVGSKGLPYNRAQDLGYSGNNLPPRPFLNIQPDLIDDIGDMISKQIEDSLD